MTDIDLDKQIADLRQRLNRLHEQKRKRKRRKKSERPRGRPPIEPARIKLAKDLAREYPIVDVALVTEMSVRTLYKYGIKRYKLNAEAERAKAGTP